MWIGCDLDGTLARNDTGTYRSTVIGPPIPLMVERVRLLLESGNDVRIFTARVAPTFCTPNELVAIRMAIEAWCISVFGRTLPITCVKDPDMDYCFDDRFVQVIPNTGRRVDGKP